MASAGKAIAGVGVGVIALFALVSSAKAKSKTKPGPAPEDMHSPEACKAYKASRTDIVNSRNQLQKQLYDVNNAMKAAADAGDEEQLKNLASIQQGLKSALADANMQLNNLDALIADCP